MAILHMTSSLTTHKSLRCCCWLVQCCTRMTKAVSSCTNLGVVGQLLANCLDVRFRLTCSPRARISFILIQARGMLMVLAYVTPNCRRTRNVSMWKRYLKESQDFLNTFPLKVLSYNKNSFCEWANHLL